MSHQVHLLEFITDDFYRMQTSVFAGYAKPVLDVVNGRLVVTNVPVPKRSHHVTWFKRHLMNLHRLRTVEFLSRVFRKMQAAATNEALSREAGNRKTREILRKIFEELKNLRDQRSIQPVLVYLPTLHELMGNGQDSQEWLEFLTKELKAVGIPLFDVMSDFRNLPAHQIVSMYIAEGQSGPNHFNDQGNAFVAEIIYEKLLNETSILQRPSANTRSRGSARLPTRYDGGHSYRMFGSQPARNAFNAALSSSGRTIGRRLARSTYTWTKCPCADARSSSLRNTATS